MGIPATLSTVPEQTPYIQYVATSGQTVFPYPFEITQDSDLVAVANGTTLATDSGYTLSGVGNATGGNLTFTSGRTVGDIITLYRDIPIERLTQFAQNGGFSSTAFNAEFNNVYLLLQQLQQNIDQCLQIPNTNNPAPTTTLLPATWAGKYMSFDSNGNPAPAALTSSGSITGAILGGILKSYNGPITANDVRSYGVVGDGVTDDTAAFQSAVNANKGGVVYVPYGITPLIAGVALVGSSYNGTIIRVDGELILKASPAPGTTNYKSGGGVGIGAYVGIAFENCDHCQFEGKWNGNRVNQPQDEHIFCLALSGVTNFRAPNAAFREIRGDGLYLDQVSWGVNGSAPCTNVSIGSIQGYNSANDGRNLVSVICCVGLSIGSVDSYQVGGVVNGVTEPGGFDIEPDFGYQPCTDISIGSVSVVTAGTAGLSIQGKAITNDATRDWCVQRVVIGAVSVKNTNSAGSAAALNVARARHLSIIATCTGTIPGNGSAAAIDYADHINADLNLFQANNAGLYLGFADYVQDSVIKANVYSYANAGILAVGLKRTKLIGRVSGATNATSTFAVQLSDAGRGSGVTQTDVTYSVDCPYDGNNTRGVYARTVTIGTGTCIRDCDLTGYAANLALQFDGGGAIYIPSYNVQGRNVGAGLTAAPVTGYFAAGDEIALDQVAGATVPRVKCIANGNPGTWIAYGFAGVAPVTGWGTPTGAAVQNNYSGGAATLAQTSAALAEVITALKSAGILGA